MRKKSKKQMPLMPPEIDHPQAEELRAISRILDSNPIIYDLVMQDLSPKRIKSKAGAKGMSAEQVIRAAIVKQMFEFSYKDLAFHLIDSVSLKRFCHIGIADKGFKKSVLCKNIKAISPATWEAANRCVVQFAKDTGIDEIVIGIKRRSKVGKLLFGSTAQYTILNANCPVLTIK